jgi:hypothetical protein
MPSPKKWTTLYCVRKWKCLSTHHLRSKTRFDEMPVSTAYPVSINADPLLVAEKQDLLAIILRSPDAPCLDRNQMQRVFRASRAYKQYKAYQADLDDSDDDEGPENDDAWLFEDLTVMMKLLLRKREKEQLLALIFEVSCHLFVVNESSQRCRARRLSF